MISQETMGVWGAAFREDKDHQAYFIKMDFFTKFYPQLLKECSDKMLRELGNPENDSNVIL
jgi:hypothetical protein